MQEKPTISLISQQIVENMKRKSRSRKRKSQIINSDLSN